MLTQERWFLLLAACALGALIGSFLNVVIYRLPLMMERAWEGEIAAAKDRAPVEGERFNLVLPRSRCGSCGHVITVLENIPVISWIALRGKCSACGSAISARYPFVEISTAALFFACAWAFGPTLLCVAAMSLCAVLVALTGIDLDTQLLPDQLTLPLLWLGLLLNIGGLFVTLPDAVIGAAAGYLVLWSVYWLFKLVTGREGMGYGDFKLLGALGAWFGWQALPVLLLVSAVVGSVIGIAVLVVQKKGRQTAIAFGPYLALSGLIMLFFRTQIQQLPLVL